MGKIKVGLIGIGNCASAIVQGVLLSKKDPDKTKEILFTDIGGYKIEDIDFTLAIDVDVRKIGKDLGDAIFEGPNLFPKIVDDTKTGVKVIAGPVLDGVADHMRNIFMPHNKEVTMEEIVSAIKSSGTEVLVNMLPVGSEEATRFYAEAAIKAGVAFINGMPVFIASDPKGEWQEKFKKAGLPVLGDDVKGQFGATILHSSLTALMRERGLRINETYQLNIGGNTDFLNMKEEERLRSKRESKTSAVLNTLTNPKEILEKNRIRIGPSDWVPFLGNTKIAYIYVRATSFLGFPVELDVKLKVDDKSQYAAAMIDVIRLAKLALDNGLSGAIHEASAYYMKHPPKPVSSPYEARSLLEEFIRKYGKKSIS
ncbi:inositol-3-phosphate synthase [Fervidicoccus fontis]|jgi:myo-inositol-1-phosphate synthase|uniref:Inositol-3-phosphate synthase n=1 Tax=Fervidicoccus fontis TaxID=683846 RepID=A0A2J6N3R6_9CREN|nr:inositol-3-phosphate synthase [Fervidicoccus fontis]MBE9391642.1 inositol-3-phosphate synthase [Fervidicoccus fontis]PMB75960.1 MAG: inositol-3-phosphate synthase [Fervidicoccus fontis]PMB77847.1 MAG: inositol-3-phosphate synthase [Fervidicoccus fontis]HEW63480.1 inositol-3-phosphate synthase [Fervidicoccus fontis]